jgi:hypothetical protein
MVAQGKVALMSAGSLHQLHIFIFVLAVFHVAYSVVTMALSRLKVSTTFCCSNQPHAYLSVGRSVSQA